MSQCVKHFRDPSSLYLSMREGGRNEGRDSIIPNSYLLTGSEMHTATYQLMVISVHLAISKFTLFISPPPMKISIIHKFFV